MIRFYSPDILQTESLSEIDSGHCCRVLRAKNGEEIEVVDGKGNIFHCKIKDANPKHTVLEILSQSKESKHWKNNITLAVAPTKNIDRIEWLLEKSVEIGVDKIVLVKCERSERKNINIQRLEKIIASAMKQSLKAQLPHLDGLVDFKNFVESIPQDQEKFIGYCAEDIQKKKLVDEYTPLRDVTILIGPEGDFSPQEVQNALNNGFKCVTFGDTRLRTETAALYSLANIHTINEIKANLFN